MGNAPSKLESGLDWDHPQYSELGCGNWVARPERIEEGNDRPTECSNVQDAGRSEG